MNSPRAKSPSPAAAQAPVVSPGGPTAPRSLVLRLVTGLAKTIGLSSLLALVVFVFYGLQKNEVDIRRDSLDAAAKMAEVLELPFWDLDTTRTAFIADAFAKDPRVARIDLFDHDGNQIYSAGNGDTGDVAWGAHAVLHNGQQLGEVKVAFSQATYRRQLARLVWTGSWFSLLGLLVAFLSTGLLVRHYLGPPLQQLTAVVNAYAENDYPQQAVDFPYVEFQPFSAVLQHMGQKIQRQLSQLRDSEENYRLLVNNAEEGIVVIQNVHVQFANRSALNLLGYPEAELRSKPFLEFIHPDDRERIADMHRRRMAGEAVPSRTTSRLLPKNGFAAWVETGTVMFEWQGGPATLNFMTEVTDRRLAEEALRSSEQRFRAIFESEPECVMSMDIDGILLDVNPAGLEMLELESAQAAVGRSILEWILPEWHEALELKLGELIQGQPLRAEFEMVGSQGTQRWVDTHAVPMVQDKEASVTILAVTRDISDRKRVEKERAAFEEYLRQSQKMEAIGVLAGGIAHDFNNLLFAIMGYGDLVLSSLEPKTLTYDNMQGVLAAARRAKGLVQQILTFSRKTQVEQIPLDLKVYVKEVVKLLRVTLPSSLELKLSLSAEAAMVFGDPTEIHQVLMNLCTNAAHAIGDKPGRLEIALRELELTAPAAVGPGAQLAPGPYWELTVSDTGSGMPPEVQQRIFDPFFTTKAQGKGTGMGLSVVHGIISRLGGEIAVESEVGVGTRFTIRLPAHLGDRQSKGTKAKTPHGSAHVLVVDDDADILAMLRQSLAGLGYTVTCCEAGQDALAQLRSAPDSVDIVITDQTMPQLTGLELAQQIQELQPGLPVIVCTGFSEAVSPELVGSHGIAGLLYKPVPIGELARAIDAALQPALPAGPAELAAAPHQLEHG